MIKMRIYQSIDCEVTTSDLREMIGSVFRVKGCMLLFCERGKAIVAVNIERRVLRRGDVVVVFPDILFVVHAVSRDFEARRIEISSELSDEVVFPLSSAFFERVYNDPVLSTTEEQQALLAQWNGQLTYVLQYSDAKSFRMMLRNQLQNLFLVMETKIVFGFSSEGIRPSISSRRLFDRFCRLVVENCYGQRGVKFYADKLCITPYYLSRITLQNANMSPKQVVDWQVVMEIKHLLVTTGLTVKEIANRFHFESISYLGRYFRRHTGLTPTEYRNQ